MGTCGELQREWLERQQKAQPVEAATWPEHIFRNFFILVNEDPALLCSNW